MALLRTFNIVVNNALEKFLIIGFSLMTLVIFLQVIFRYFLLQSLSWSEEIARYLFVWLTFLGASVVAKNQSHIMVGSLVNSIKNDVVRKSFQSLAHIMVLVFLYVLTVEGFAASFEILDLGQSSPSLPWLPLGAIYFAIPLGSLFMALNTIEHVWSLWCSDRIKGVC